MARLIFLQDNHNHASYTGSSLRNGPLGGTESSVVQLAEALAARGHEVFAANRLNDGRTEWGVRWLPLQHADDLPKLDIAIGINSNKILGRVKSSRNITWLHNPPSNGRQFRFGNIAALLRRRPHAVLLGSYHASLLHPRLPYAGRSIIGHGIAADFLLPEAQHSPRPRRAIFTSQPARGLSLLVAVWPKVRSLAPDAELHVFAPPGAKHREAMAQAEGQPGIVVRGSVSRAQLALELQAARIMTIPGAREETFCLAAAEAIACGTPLVTLGVGSLAERVRHGETGLLARDEASFALAAARLLTDDGLWLTMHGNCVHANRLATWDQRAREWETLSGQLLR